jgi:hypothetical protein
VLSRAKQRNTIPPPLYSIHPFPPLTTPGHRRRVRGHRRAVFVRVVHHRADRFRQAGDVPADEETGGVFHRDARAAAAREGAPGGAVTRRAEC